MATITVDVAALCNKIVKYNDAFCTNNDPSFAVDATNGFVAMLLTKGCLKGLPQSVIVDGCAPKVIVPYITRLGADAIINEPTCDGGVTPTQKFAEISDKNYSGINLFLPLENVCSLNDEQRGVTRVGDAVMHKWLFDVLRSGANAIISDVDKKLVAKQMANFGANAANNYLTTAKPLQFKTKADLTSGMTRLVTDMQMNNMFGEMCIVGNGAVQQYQNFLKEVSPDTCCGAVGSRCQNFNIFYDANTVTEWGADHFGVFEPAMTRLVTWKSYSDILKANSSQFKYFDVQFPIPYLEGCVVKYAFLNFECRLRLLECVEAGSAGYQLHMGLNYGLFNSPSTLFGANAPENADKMKGVNGTFHYVGALA